MEYLALLQSAVLYGSQIKQVIDEALTNDDIVTKVKTISSPLATVLESVGSAFFPKVAPALHIAAAVMSSFDPSVTKWTQRSLNQLVSPSPNLVVDGIYGPATRAAVEALQTQVGLTVDGWAGQITQGVIGKLLASK